MGNEKTEQGTGKRDLCEPSPLKSLLSVALASCLREAEGPPALPGEGFRDPLPSVFGPHFLSLPKLSNAHLHLRLF